VAAFVHPQIAGGQEGEGVASLGAEPIIWDGTPENAFEDNPVSQIRSQWIFKAFPCPKSTLTSKNPPKSHEAASLKTSNENLHRAMAHTHRFTHTDGSTHTTRESHLRCKSHRLIVNSHAGLVGHNTRVSVL
jgi:hypothetical protein